MAISVSCPECGKSYLVDEKLAGRKGTCKKCEAVFRIPGEPPPPAQTPYRQQILEHVAKHIGAVPQAFHKLVSKPVRVDMHIIPPTLLPASKAHPRGTYHYTIVTCGLSALPMRMPRGEKASPYAELMIALPDNWPGMKLDGTFDAAMMDDPLNGWPLRWLRGVARLPHSKGGFLAPGRIFPNGENAAPFATNTRLAAMMVFPGTLSHAAGSLKIDDRVTIDFYALYPLYPDEMLLHQNKGLEALINAMMKAQVTELIKRDRPNVGIK